MLGQALRPVSCPPSWNRVFHVRSSTGQTWVPDEPHGVAIVDFPRRRRRAAVEDGVNWCVYAAVSPAVDLGDGTLRPWEVLVGTRSYVSVSPPEFVVHLPMMYSVSLQYFDGDHPQFVRDQVDWLTRFRTIDINNAIFRRVLRLLEGVETTVYLFDRASNLERTIRTRSAAAEIDATAANFPFHLVEIATGPVAGSSLHPYMMAT